MKKIISAILSVIMCAALMTGCGEKDSASGENTYSGILTRIKLGMPSSKIISMQPDGVDLYYEDDTTIWSVNNDTDLKAEVTALVPENDAYFYADDSIITYLFKTKKGEDDIFLNGYSEEVHCLIDRTAAEEYFNKKTEELIKKHCTNEGCSAGGAMTGTEDVDMELVYKQTISASSYYLNFSMTLTYDTVNGVSGYYATMFKIELDEKEVKEEVTIDTPETE